MEAKKKTNLFDTVSGVFTKELKFVELWEFNFKIIFVYIAEYVEKSALV